MRSPAQYVAIVIFLISLAASFANNDLILLLPFTLLIAVIAFLYPYFQHYTFEGKIEREEQQESLLEGGIEESHAFRQLEPLEEYKLREMHKISRRIASQMWWLLVVFAIIDYFLIKFFVLDPGEFNDDAMQIPFIVLFVEGLIVSLAIKEKNRYLDLRSPVFKVQGKIIKEKIKGKRSTHYYVTVRKNKFSDKDFPELDTVFDSFTNGEEVAIEYSPRTKHVWKLYKTPDI